MARDPRTRSEETAPGRPDGRWDPQWDRPGTGAVLFLLACAFLLTVWTTVTGRETTVIVSREAQEDRTVTTGTPSTGERSDPDIVDPGDPPDAAVPGDGPVPDAPSPDDPGTEAPVGEDPKVDALIEEISGAAVPAGEDPDADVPVEEVPGTVVPAEEDPDTDAPAEEVPDADGTSVPEEIGYVLNTNSKKFHLPSCPSAAKISEKNREVYTGDREDLLALGYDPCKICMPPESGT